MTNDLQARSRCIPSFAALSMLFLTAMLSMPGCAFNRNTEAPSSGDPEADRRASQRVGGDATNAKNSKAAQEQTLYDRLGGSAAIAALVDDMTARTLADPRVNFARENVRTNFLGAKYKAWQSTPENVDAFKKHMSEFLTLASGGPSQYSGREIREVHKGMKITNNEFDAMVGDIKASLDKLGVGTREKRDLLAIIETTRKQIVEEP